MDPQLKKKKATSKGLLTRFQNQMDTIFAASLIDLEDICKLEAILVNYRSQKEKFESIMHELLEVADATHCTCGVPKLGKSTT